MVCTYWTVLEGGNGFITCTKSQSLNDLFIYIFFYNSSGTVVAFVILKTLEYISPPSVYLQLTYQIFCIWCTQHLTQLLSFYLDSVNSTIIVWRIKSFKIWLSF